MSLCYNSLSTKQSTQSTLSEASAPAISRFFDDISDPNKNTINVSNDSSENRKTVIVNKGMDNEHTYWILINDGLTVIDNYNQEEMQEAIKTVTTNK